VRSAALFREMRGNGTANTLLEAAPGTEPHETKCVKRAGKSASPAVSTGATELTAVPGEVPTRGLISKMANRLTDFGHGVLDFVQGDGRFKAIIEALPAAIYTTDAEGRITFFNEAAATMWGRRPQLGVDYWCGCWKIYTPAGALLPHDECPMAVALKTRRPVRGVEAVAERPDGTRVPFAPYPTPLFDASGALVGAVNMLVDLTNREEAQENAQRLAAIVQSSEDAIISKDLDGIILSWNKGAERLFGYSAEEIIHKSVTLLIASDRPDEEPRIIERLRRGERIDHYETVRRRKDGSLVDISLSVSPIVAADGRIIGASSIARDISQQKVLLAEIMHRVKNTLATVQAMATQTLQRTAAEERDAFTARLHALSKAHDLLTRDRWDRASVRSVIDAALAPFQRQRFTVEGPDIDLSASEALQFALAVHELATNAVKYGALSNDTGRIVISAKTTKRRGLRLTWLEQDGPPVKHPSRKGFGSLLIERTFERARMRYWPHGLACTFDVTHDLTSAVSRLRSC
jgi:PAS domain S-box-containing protein